MDADAHQTRALAVWVHMREGAPPAFRGTNLDRQAKPLLVRVCALLDLPADGTKAALVLRIRGHVFSQAQRQEMLAFKERLSATSRTAAVVGYHRWQLEKLSSGPRPFARAKNDVVEAARRRLDAELQRAATLDSTQNGTPSVKEPK